MRKMKLTKSVIDAAAYDGRAVTGKDGRPRWTRCLIFDTELPGFGLRITETGKKTYVVRYRVRGRERLVTVGVVGIETIKEARDEARDILVAARKGVDLRKERERRDEAPMLAEVFERWKRAPTRRTKRAPREGTVKAAEGVWKRHLEREFGSRRLDEITKPEIADLQLRLAKNPWAANDAVKLLRVLFNRAIRWELVPAGFANPADGLDLLREEKRKRYLSVAELERLARALELEDKKHPDGAAAVRLLLFTGCRPGEIQSLEWSQVDLKEGLLRLPETKAGESQERELPPPALEVLNRLTRRRRRRSSPYVFPNSADRSRPRGDYFRRSWRRLRRRAGLADVHLHDLRHTHASFAVRGGLSLVAIGGLLGHKDSKSTERYAHLMRDSRRSASEAVAEAIQAAMEGESDEQEPATQ